MAAELTPSELARRLIDESIGGTGQQRPIPRRSKPAPARQEDEVHLDRASTGFRTRYPKSRGGSGTDRRVGRRLLMAVSTFNRRNYIERFAETFAETRNPDHEWTLVVADDGSTDTTLEYLRQLEIPACRVVVIENKNKTITGQTNSMLAVAMLVDPDLAFKADDDIFFREPGWDDLYLAAVESSGYDHLVYHNTDWKPRQHEQVRGAVESFVPAMDTMGCFYTFTPRLVERIGYLDEVNFRFRGHGHLDWTMRACRVGHNEAQHVWDAAGSARFIDMWARDEYESLVDWNSAKVKSILNDEERKRRMDLILQDDRVYVEHRSPVPAPVVPRAHVVPYDPELWQLLDEHSVARPAPETPGAPERVYVLNMDADIAKWADTAGMLARGGLEFQRFAAIDGGTEENVADWRSYEAEGLVLDLEKRLNRRLIQSTGAWGYLKTMQKLLQEAIDQRYEWILVFDDDIMVHSRIEELLDATLRQIPESAAVVYLGNSQVDQSAVSPVNDFFYHPGGEANGSFAVLYHSSTFASLTESIQRFEAPFDAGPLREIDHQRPRDVFALWEPLVIADVSSSSIRKPRDMDAFAERFNWDLDQYEERADSSFEPALSVLIVGHNVEATLPVTLESLRYQTRADIEILVGDNASTDNTPAVVKELRKRDTRVRGFRTDRPVDDATLTNRLLGFTTGKWVSLLPAEACLPRDHYRKMLEAAEDAGAGAVRAGAVIGGVAATPPASNDQRARLRTSTGGIVLRDRVQQVGGYRDTDEPGQQELEDRIRTYGASRGYSFVVDRQPKSTIWLPSIARSTSRQESKAFHREIERGQRSARVPAPKIDITEFG